RRCGELGPATSPRPKAAPLSVHDVPATTRGSAGIDLVNQEDMDITLPGEVLLMPSQIQGPLPEGMVGLVLPRSSASKQGLFVVPGVVDSDYGGIIHVQLWSHLPKQLFQGDAWAQLILVLSRAGAARPSYVCTAPTVIRVPQLDSSFLPSDYLHAVPSFFWPSAGPPPRGCYFRFPGTAPSGHPH
uniref:dUTPase-like domain-containing protein n=1 Tax=Terrapene triunguis TaxID=2587831 RepID=A0A674JUG6_9SAUR